MTRTSARFHRGNTVNAARYVAGDERIEAGTVLRALAVGRGWVYTILREDGTSDHVSERLVREWVAS